MFEVEKLYRHKYNQKYGIILVLKIEKTGCCESCLEKDNCEGSIIAVGNNPVPFGSLCGCIWRSDYEEVKNENAT